MPVLFGNLSHINPPLLPGRYNSRSSSDKRAVAKDGFGWIALKKSGRLGERADSLWVMGRSLERIDDGSFVTCPDWWSNAYERIGRWFWPCWAGRSIA
jgi:hypothetical protein